MSLRLMSSVSALLFFSLFLALERGHRYGAVLLVPTAIVGLVVHRKKLVVTKDIKWLSASFLFMALVALINSGVISENTSTYEHLLKYTLVVLLLVYLYNFPASPNFIWWGCALGGIATGILAVYFSFFAPEIISRASPYLNPIQYGNYSAVLAGFCICGLSIEKRLLNGVLVLGAILATIALLLSQSRGSWVGFLLFVSFFTIWQSIRLRPSIKHILYGVCLAALAVTAIYSKFGSMIEGRVMSSYNNVVSFYQDGRNDSSSGQRLQMWEFAIHEGLQYPLLGAGKEQLEDDKKRWVSEGRASTAILAYGHLHNEFFNTFAKRGLLGLAALICLLAVPFILFAGYKRSTISSSGTNRLRNAGMATSIMFAGFGLTEVSLGVYSAALLLFTFSICIFYTSYRAEQVKMSQSYK